MRPAKESLGRAEVVVALVAVLSYPLTFVAAISAACSLLRASCNAF